MNKYDKVLDLADGISDFKLLSSRDIPRIDLYMEQIIQFLEQEFGDSLRKKGEPVFTNTMVNNYTKEGVMPRSDNKRYNKRHIMTLIYIFILKQNLSIPEIKEFTSHIESDEELEEMYRALRGILNEYQPKFLQEIKNKIEIIDKQFDSNGTGNEKVKIMTLISLISYETALNTLLSSALLEPENFFLHEEPKEKDESIDETND